jgi:hypothetical protein
VQSAFKEWMGALWKPETLKDSKGSQVGITNRDDGGGTLKYRVIAKVPKFGWNAATDDNKISF